MLHIESTPIRLSLALLGLGGFAVFVLPMLLAHIVNIGNGFGAAFSLAFAGFFVWNDKISAGLERLCSHTAGKAVFGVCVALLCIGLAFFLVVSGLMLGKMRDKPKQPAEVLIVLGCKVRGEAPSRMLRARLDAAYAYLSANPETTVVVSGGKGSDEDISEALCMYRYLTGRGIDPARILQEDQSTGTAENLRFSQRLLAEHGISCKTVAVATDGFHQLRASMLADDIGWETDAVPAKTRAWLLPTYWVREVFGVLYTVIA